MEITLLIFLSSGLFLGWSLGANDAANVFGTAVGSRMIQFTTAAIICSLFVILGAVISGAGAAHGLGKLGQLNALPGAFMAAFSAAITVYAMTRAGLPVSTTQAVVGAIVGWNWFSGSITDATALTKILATWVACPLLGALFGAMLYKAVTFIIDHSRIHVLRLDSYTRIGLILAGAFGAYSLGANNIGNVMGVFVSSSPFTPVTIGDWFTLTSVQQLFFFGAVAIAVGVFTYSKRVMMTVGSGVLPLNPVGAWVVVISHSIVLFLFSSLTLEHFLASNGLPTIPLIPVSSSQAVVGAVIGIGLLKGGKAIRWRALGGIASGWVTTPVAASIICFVMLFFLQNVFNQVVFQKVYFELGEPAMEHLREAGVPTETLTPIAGQRIESSVAFRDAVRTETVLPKHFEDEVIETARLFPMRITREGIAKLDTDYIKPAQIDALRTLMGSTFDYRWRLEDALAEETPEWRKLPENKVNKSTNKYLQEQLGYIYSVFEVKQEASAS
jgi:PiT family inorganic phosphate transporter